MLTIGEVAQMAGTTVRAVRHYHQTGLLPEPARSPNGYRRYRGSDLSRLLQIRQLGDLGLALADIRRLVDGSAEERRAALEGLRDQYADEERRLAERRSRITELLAVDGDPAIPTAFRAWVNTLQTIGAPEHLMAVDAEIFRATSGLVSPDEQQAVTDAMTALKDDPGLIVAVAGYMRRLDAVTTLPPDHPDVAALAADFARFLQRVWPQLVSVDDPDSDPDMEWIVQDLLSERLAPTQVVVMRGVIDRLRAPRDTGAGNDATPPS